MDANGCVQFLPFEFPQIKSTLVTYTTSNIWSDNIWVVNYVHLHFFENSENLAFSWVNYRTVVINLNILTPRSFAVS